MMRSLMERVENWGKFADARALMARICPRVSAVNTGAGMWSRIAASSGSTRCLVVIVFSFIRIVVGRILLKILTHDIVQSNNLCCCRNSQIRLTLVILVACFL
jgi:hypothetical protein